MSKVAYSEAIADYICEEVGTGRGLQAICRDDPGMPPKRDVYRWLAKYPEFATKFGVAQLARSDALVEEMLDIADDASLDVVTRVDKHGKPYQAPDLDHIQRSKLMMEARWKLAGAYNRSKYGNKVLHGGDPDPGATPIRHAIEFVITDPDDPADSGSEEA